MKNFFDVPDWGGTMTKYTCGAGTPEEAEANCTSFINGQCTASWCEYRKKKQTNADRIRSMSDEKLAQFIHEITHLRETPWSIPFEEANCKSCSHVIGLVDGYYQETEFHECDFEDGKCPHGNDILWWLHQEAEEE